MTDLLALEDETQAFDLADEISTLLGKLGTSQVEPVAYDTAWVARLGKQDATLASQALAWLRDNQLEDGSWGAAMPRYHHDRAISTLAAINALQLHGAPDDRPRIEAALPALNYSLAHLHEDTAGRTIAFEMLLPSLVMEAQQHGLSVADPLGIVQEMLRLRDAKLAKAPGGMIDRHTTLGFSAEMVGRDGIHLLDLDDLQQSDGSVGVSPAATAFFAAYVRPDPAALRYLRNTVKQGGAPAITAIDIFERAWTLWNFTRGRTLDPVIARCVTSWLDSIASHWDPAMGIAHATTFAVHDGDDTGLVYELLAQFGRTPDPAPLWYYEEDRHFRCFDLENHVSVSTNVHMLGALRAAGYPIHHSAVRKIAGFLRSEAFAPQFWVDKWHASPYYATGHAIVVAAGYYDELVDAAVQWLLDSQNEDGSWGYYAATAEETAYSLQALMCWYQQGHSLPNDVLTRGITWLMSHSQPPYAPLWVGKCLYCPSLVVRSTILSVLVQYQNDFKPLPNLPAYL